MQAQGNSIRNMEKVFKYNGMDKSFVKGMFIQGLYFLQASLPNFAAEIFKTFEQVIYHIKPYVQMKFILANFLYDEMHIVLLKPPAYLRFSEVCLPQKFTRRSDYLNLKPKFSATILQFMLYNSHLETCLMHISKRACNTLKVKANNQQS